MAKTRDYKEMQVTIEKADGEMREMRTLIDGLTGFWKSKNNAKLRVQFKMKRRQLVSTWQTQISKAAVSHLMEINKARTASGRPEFTYETLMESFIFTYTEDDGNIEMVVW